MTELPAYKKQKIVELIPYCNNSRTHTSEQVSQIASSIKEFGFTNPILVDEQGGVIAGHGRIAAAKKCGMKEVPTLTLEGLTEAQKKAYVIADNQLALNAGWNEEMLKLEVEALQEMDFDINLLGFEDLFLDGLGTMNEEGEEGEEYDEGVKGSMKSNFGVPPFTVLNAREGRWQSRKRDWLALGIKSEEGRDIKNTNASESINKGPDKGGSIFDPVLCEIIYSWFSKEGDMVLDPFAGGSVRGIVAAECGRYYIGNDLRKEQVEANREQASDICKSISPVWTHGDSRNIKKLVGDVRADMVLSCPPYADLEVYSDDDDDLSNMDYTKFLECYSEIIKETYDMMKDDTFAVWVIGEVRDKEGNYYNFLGDTITAFLETGFKYYNETVLVTAVGSLPLRAGRVMKTSRKLGKTHQNVLVFVKGCGKKAAQKCGEIEIEEWSGDDNA
jgi:DNA modification methylase